MKTFKILAGCLALFFYSCKKTPVVLNAFADAYFRLVFLDAPGGTVVGNTDQSGKVQFFLDGKVNVNGDSLIHNQDGTIYREDPANASTPTINYPAGGWSDNSPLSFVGVYGYYFAKAGKFSYYPNPGNRIALGPIYSGLNFFNWAKVGADKHDLSVFSVVNASLFGNDLAVKGPLLYKNQLVLDGKTLQTSFFYNRAPCKAYSPSGVNTRNGLPYAMAESIKYYSENYEVVSFQDHLDRLPAFKDSSAYVRFMNMSPTYNDQLTNANTDSLDVYIAPLYGRPDYNSGLFIRRFADSIGREVLVASKLARFQSYVDQPFIEIPLAPYMRTINGRPDTIGRPRYFRVLAYRTGQSKVKGYSALAYGDWLSIFNQFQLGSFLNDTDPIIPLGTPATDSFLLRYDGKSYHPTVATIPIAVSQESQPLLNQAFLGYRSIINYVPVGVNARYYHE